MFKDLTKEVPPIMHVLNIHENLLEALLEMGNYAGNLFLLLLFHSTALDGLNQRSAINLKMYWPSSLGYKEAPC